jgi:opacity protein-like surface antigen
LSDVEIDMSRMRIGSWVLFAVAPLLVVLVPQRAEALINAGAEAGIVKRSADAPSNLDLGIGYGVHGELGLLPFLNIGPYYLHYELSSADRPAFGSADAAFNTLGLRARVTLPIPGSLKPYALAGTGYTWVNYSPAGGDRSGHFLEIPIGVGLGFEKLLEIFQLSLDATYRPAVAFGGDAFSGLGAANHPTNGWSLLLGAAVNL